MFDWIKNAVNGVANVLQGKSWNGDDPDKIKAEAQAEINKITQETNATISQIQASNSKSNKIMLLGLAGALGFGVYTMAKGRRW